MSVFTSIGTEARELWGGGKGRLLVGPVAGVVLLPFVEGFRALADVTVLLSTMLGSGAVIQSFLSDTISANIRGIGLGVVRTAAATLGAMGPVVFGAIADRGYFDEGYLLLGVIAVVVILSRSDFPDHRSCRPRA